MQKVERRKHRTGRRTRLVWVLACALVLAAGVTAGILLTKRAEEEPGETRQHITGAITQRQAEDLELITITRRGQASWTGIRREDGTLMIQPEEGSGEAAWPADRTVGDLLQDAAANQTNEDVFTENREDWAPNAADFGLEDPLILFEIRFTDGTEVTARIGDSADPEDDAYYYLAVDGDDRLMAVASGTVRDLDTEAQLLRETRKLEILGALLDRITVRNGDGSIRTEWRLQGKVTDQDAAENWIISAPFVYAADYDTMKNMRDNAENLRPGVYVGSAGSGDLSAYGLEEPSAVLELHMAAGSTGTVSESGVYDVVDWEERTEVLTVGNAKTDMVDYVRIGDEIYTMNHFILSLFTETDALSTAARYPVATPLNSLESVTVEKRGEEPVRYALIHTDALTETDSTEETTGTCVKNGEEISWEAFSAAWERLLTVTVSGRLPDGFTPGEPHTTYLFQTVSGGEHTLELSDYDGMHDAVKLDGNTLFYLIRGGMTELP